jgi:hypothetical protein
MTFGTVTMTQQAAGSIPGWQQHKSSNRPSLRLIEMGLAGLATKTFSRNQDPKQSFTTAVECRRWGGKLTFEDADLPVQKSYI